jgi:hypothetical protein
MDSENTPPPTQKELSLDECEERLRKLEATQNQIEETSKFLIKIGN